MQIKSIHDIRTGSIEPQHLWGWLRLLFADNKVSPETPLLSANFSRIKQFLKWIVAPGLSFRISRHVEYEGKKMGTVLKVIPLNSWTPCGMFCDRLSISWRKWLSISWKSILPVNKTKFAKYDISLQLAVP